MSLRLPHRLAAFLFLLATLSLVLSGCSGEEKKTEQKEEKKPAIEVFGDAPSWPAELEKVSLGTSLEEWQKALGIEQDTLKSKTFEGIEYDIDADKDHGNAVQRLSIRFEQEDAKAYFTEKWGTPTQVKSYGDDVTYYWYNPAVRLRIGFEVSASAGRWRADFTTYIPMAEVIGTAPGPLGFEKDKPLLGLTDAEISAAYPKFVRQVSAEEDAAQKANIEAIAPEARGMMGEASAHVDFKLPPTETGAYWTNVSLFYRESNNKVERFSLSTKVAPGGDKAILDLLEAKYGKPVVGKEKDVDRFYFFSPDKQLRVIAGMDTISTDEFEIRVSNYLPLDQLVGKEKGKLAFFGEKQPFGALTKDEFSTTYKEFLPSPDSSSIHVAPTEYEEYFTSIGVFFDTKTNLARTVSFEIALEPNASYREYVLNYFKAAYGEPTPHKRHTEAEPYWVFAGDLPVTLRLGYKGNSWNVEFGSLF
ncbi:MAG: hypothetical protein AUK47_16805 [Deltaproteobacteria bacterium CG2_30_63_29]|nr:MAG: hypothetical protein AUK47_16805 [Deltaproteobacteria bacterium CG2_30_63_29]PJB41111.1 MAG: hypothetical protein CO108_13505 [Deltaproteobacteria bacterium CG_4_9_14_3_um_filter_63_12]